MCGWWVWGGGGGGGCGVWGGRGWGWGWGVGWGCGVGCVLCAESGVRVGACSGALLVGALVWRVCVRVCGYSHVHLVVCTCLRGRFGPQACLAYCHITIPSIDGFYRRMPLFLLCGRVALFNQCIAQADTFFTEAIDAIELVRARSVHTCIIDCCLLCRRLVVVVDVVVVVALYKSFVGRDWLGNLPSNLPMARHPTTRCQCRS